MLWKGGDYVNTVERRERLVQHLAINGKSTIHDLAEALGVSERTISRDLDYLSPQAPIAVEHGRRGGYYISNYKALQLPCMKEHEIELLKKIAVNTENSSSCNLTSAEHQLLENIIALYSKEGFEKMKKLEKDYNRKYS